MNEHELELLVIDNMTLVEDIVHGTCSRGVPTYIEADDLIQECLMRIPGAIKGYRGVGGATLKTYLKTAIRRDVMDLIQRERREPINSSSRSGGDVVVGIEANTVEGDESAARTAHRAAVIAYCEQESNSREWGNNSNSVQEAGRILTPEQFQAVRLCYVAGMTQEQAAKELGITREAVKSRLAKADFKLRKHLKK
jgi:RNA polymerase sigma factor (sigma-70 family)